jgi:ribosome-binding factor A
MSQNRRPQRVALQIQQEISLMLARNVKDPRIGLVTVTGVQISADLRHAKVYVSVMGSEQQKKESMEGLSNAAGWIRHELGQRIRMKFLPDIVFREDTSLEYGDRIDELLDRIREE